MGDDRLEETFAPTPRTAGPLAGGHMTPEHRQDLETLADTGRITPKTRQEFIRRGLIRQDRYGSLVLTDIGADMLHNIKKGNL